MLNLTQIVIITVPFIVHHIYSFSISSQHPSFSRKYRRNTHVKIGISGPPNFKVF